MNQAMGSGKVIWIVVVAAFLYVVWFNFNKFVVTKNYDFFVEAPCDAASESCYLRDCAEEECPANGFQSYKVWLITAADFEFCGDESCGAECEGGLIDCEAVPCDSEESNCSDAGEDEPAADEEASAEGAGEDGAEEEAE